MKLSRLVVSVILLSFTISTGFGDEAYAQEKPTQIEQSLRTPQPVSGRDLSTDEEILPADVLAHALLVGAELELVCREIGMTKNVQTELNVTGAAPREVFFQALTLYHRADRLAFELTGSIVEEHEAPDVEAIRPADVWRVVDAALGRILLIKTHLGIEEKSAEKNQDDQTIPTDVFVSIVQLNRQINSMLRKRFSPSDVFEQTTLATNYAARLLSIFPGAERRPEAPPFVRRKVPPDVYRRLLDIFASLKKISQASGLEMLELAVSEEEIQAASPSDVYDIACLLVSELSYIHSVCEGVQPPAGVFYPGQKFPSHVYQRAGILEKQIDDLSERISERPQWLKRAESE